MVVSIFDFYFSPKSKPPSADMKKSNEIIHRNPHHGPHRRQSRDTLSDPQL